MTIQKTRDYDRFKVLDGNRALNNSHLAKLTLSIAERNLLEQNPIMVNENMEVIDGQHRLEVAKNNKWEIYYIIVPRTGIDEVLMLNANVRNWKLIDYVDSLITRGNRDMAFLKDFCERYQISLTAGFILLTGQRLVRGSVGNTDALLRNVQFTEEQKKIGEKAADLLSVVREYNKKHGLIPYAVATVCRDFVIEGTDKKLAEAIRKRGKFVAISSLVPEMYTILKSYISAIV